MVLHDVVQVEQVRINTFVDAADREREREALRTTGVVMDAFEHKTTPADVQQDSQNCNSPPHRRAKRKDGAVMR